MCFSLFGFAVANAWIFWKRLHPESTHFEFLNALRKQLIGFDKSKYRESGRFYPDVRARSKRHKVEDVQADFLTQQGCRMFTTKPLARFMNEDDSCSEKPKRSDYRAQFEKSTRRPREKTRCCGGTSDAF